MTHNDPICVPGTPCDYNDNATRDDIYLANCTCRGFTTYYNMLGISGFWWSTTFSNNENNVFSPALNTSSSDVVRISNHAGDTFSIRCFKD